MPNDLFEVVGQRQTVNYEGRDVAEHGVEVTARIKATGETFAVFVSERDYTPATVAERLAARAETYTEIHTL